MATVRVERRLTAILAIDVVGYSRLMERDEAGTFTRLKRLRGELVEPILQRGGGRFVDLKGDGAIVEFGSVADAVEAAVEIQRAMLQQDIALPEDRRVRYRIGINLGDVIVDGGTIYGDGVNVAARIEGLCEPGGVWVSRSVHNQVRGKLDLAFAPTGLHQVKNISGAVETFRVVLAGVAPAPPRPVLAARPGRWRPYALAALAAAALLGGAWQFWPTEPPAGKPAIAVLPFEDYGGDAASGRLADGITEDVITDLARFRDLDVIARNSTEIYKSKPVDVRQVGRDLGVRYVLEGSIQRTEDRIRVNAQLVDARSGAHAWVNRWDLPAGDLFDAQAELADQVASRVGGYGSVAGADRAAAKRKRPEDLSAYELYLLGIEHKHRMDLADVQEAMGLFGRALARDPTLARAHVGRAWANLLLLAYFPADFAAYIAAAEADARAAVALDPQDAEAHAVLAETMYDLGRFPESIAGYERALQLNPGSADIAAFASYLGFLGQPERAAGFADAALKLNPDYPEFYPYYLGPAYFLAGRPGDTVRILAAVPSDQRNLYLTVPLAGAYAMLGQQQQAAQVIAEVQRADPSLSGETAVSGLWKFARDRERRLFLDALAKAGLPRCASDAALAGIDPKNRLPECEAERARAVARRT